MLINSLEAEFQFLDSLLRWMKFRDDLGTEDRPKSVVVIDVVIVEVGAAVVAGDTGVIVVVLLGEPLHVLRFSILSPNIENRRSGFTIFWLIIFDN